MIFGLNILKTTAADIAKRRAKNGIFNGNAESFNSRSYISYCSHRHLGSGTSLIFTRDVGHHSGGWWKNPDYERCFHLSLHFNDPETQEVSGKDTKLTREWLDLFFGEHVSMLWAEPPYSFQGKSLDVWHYRLFCDPHWQPLIPRGEVYSKQFTELGWQSYSELQWLKGEADALHLPR